MKELASILLHSQTQAHIFHLRVKGEGSYAAHKALQNYYEAIDEIADGLIESYQGRYELVEFGTVNKVDNDASMDNIISYFDKLAAAIDKLRQDEKLQDSFLQNEIDNVVTLIYATKYKLVNLQ
jgi:DNA-binding ferritin-like protein